MGLYHDFAVLALSSSSMGRWRGISFFRRGVIVLFQELDTDQAITQSIIQVMHHTITACVGLAKADQARHQSISRLPFQRVH